MITDDDESIFIAERNAMHAMDGDRVRVLVYAKRRGHDAEGEVVEIVERLPKYLSERWRCRNILHSC